MLAHISSRVTPPPAPSAFTVERAEKISLPSTVMSMSSISGLDMRMGVMSTSGTSALPSVFRKNSPSTACITASSSRSIMLFSTISPVLLVGNVRSPCVPIVMSTLSMSYFSSMQEASMHATMAIAPILKK